MSKESLSPFRMLGSYIGAVIGLIISYLSFISLAVICTFSTCESYTYIILIIPIVVGFILGWIVHGILRKIKRTFLAKFSFLNNIKFKTIKSKSKR